MNSKSMNKKLQLWYLLATLVGLALAGVSDAIHSSVLRATLRTVGIAFCGLGLFALGYLVGVSRKAKKCPQCGKMVGLFDMVCRYCMYWFEDGKRK